MIEKLIVLEDIDPVIFYGVNNANIQLIKALYPKLRIVARGNVIKVLGDEEETETDKYIAKLQEHFVPKEGMDASFRLDLTDVGKSLIVDVKGAKLDCYYGTMENPDVIAKVATSVLEQILNGEKPFQNAFMSGDLSAQGNFKALRNFDAVFRFS